MSVIHILFIFITFKKQITAMENVQILFVNEDTNHVSERSVEAAMQYIKKQFYLKVQVDIQTVTGSKNDSSFLQSLCDKYKKMITSQTPPHVVLDTTTMGLASETVKYFTASLALPTISTSYGQEGDLRQWTNITDEEKKYLVHIVPPADVVTNILRAFVITQKITNAAVLHDSTFNLDHKLKTLLQNFDTRHLVIPVNFTDIRTQLKNLKKQDISNFFIFGDMSTIKYVLDCACEMKYLTSLNAWHVVSFSTEELKCNCSDGKLLYAYPEFDVTETKKLEFLKNTHGFNKKTEITAAFYFDLALFTVLTIRDMITDKAWPQDMLYLTCENFTHESKLNRLNLNFKKYFNKYFSVSPTYGPFGIRENGWSQMEFNMSISAATTHNNLVDNVKLATWNAKNQNNFTIVHSDPNILESYVSEQLYTVVTMQQKPFVYVDKTAPNGFRGYCIDLLNEIAKYCKFNYEIRLVSDGEFGSMNSNGEWNGLVRELIDKKSDIALGTISVSAERESVIDFTVPYYEAVGISILMKRTLPSQSLFKFLSVLDTEVWLCLLTTYCFTSFVMWIFDRCSPFSYQNNIKKSHNSKENRLFTFKECLWFCITSLTPQGGGEAPKTLSGRLIAAVWWLFGFIIISSYTANLAAFLTVTRLHNPVTSMDELSKQYKIAYAPVNGSFAMTYFERMAYIEHRFYEIWENMSLNENLPQKEKSSFSTWEYPISDKYTKMWQMMKKTGLPVNDEEAIERVRDSKSKSDGFAFIGEGTDLKYFSLLNCDLEVVGDEFSKKPLAIGVQKNSPLKLLISNAIMNMIVKRKLQILKQKWWADNPEAQVCNDEGILQTGISIRNIGGIFIIIFVGIISACILLFIENRKNKNNK